MIAQRTNNMMPGGLSYMKPQGQRMQMGQSAGGPVDASSIMMNLCPRTFLPIIMFKERPLCKVCI